MKAIIQLLIIFCNIMNVLCQEYLEPNKSHEHIHEKHEIGVAASPVYTFSEDEWAMSLHLHYTVRLLPDERYALGLGYEHVFDEHNHNFLGLVGQYTPIKHLVLGLSPGVAFETGDFSEVQFACHIEVLYEFAIGRYHIGPVFEISYESDMVHIGAGVHLGLGL